MVVSLPHLLSDVLNSTLTTCITVFGFTDILNPETSENKMYFLEVADVQCFQVYPFVLLKIKMTDASVCTAKRSLKSTDWPIGFTHFNKSILSANII